MGKKKTTVYSNSFGRNKDDSDVSEKDLMDEKLAKTIRKIVRKEVKKAAEEMSAAVFTVHNMTQSEPSIDCIIPTVNGDKKLSELVEGDMIYGKNGKHVKIHAIKNDIMSSVPHPKTKMSSDEIDTIIDDEDGYFYIDFDAFGASVQKIGDETPIKSVRLPKSYVKTILANVFNGTFPEQPV